MRTLRKYFLFIAINMLMHFPMYAVFSSLFRAYFIVEFFFSAVEEVLTLRDSPCTCNLQETRKTFYPGRRILSLFRSNLFLTLRDFSVVYSYNHCLPLTSGFLLASWFSGTPLPFQIENGCPRKYDVCAPQNFGAM